MSEEWGTKLMLWPPERTLNRQVRILAVGDTHTRHQALVVPEDVNLILFEGDFTEFRKWPTPNGGETLLLQWQEFDRWCGELKQARPGLEIVVVLGNHEVEGNPRAENLLTRQIDCYRENWSLQHATLLRHGTIELFGLTIAGFSFKDHPEDPKTAFPGVERIDFLITHVPSTVAGELNDPAKAYPGQTCIDEIIRQTQPSLHICGHAHGWGGRVCSKMWESGFRTVCCNAAVLDGEGVRVPLRFIIGDE